MNIPQPQNTTAALIDAAHEAMQEQPRAHLGASIIGHTCERYIWLSFRWAFKQQFIGRMKRLFRRGHNEEETIIQDLRMIGCEVKTYDQETGKQLRFDDGHFGGSCDGLITYGVPEAKKTPHILEAKTHSLKSFTDLKAKGVKESKPQHYAQCQVYMHAFDVDRALYYAVCKDNDEIYTERIERNKDEGMSLFEKAQRIISSDRMPAPLSADPTWYQCKFCAAHDICHGSKLTKQVNCRTCAHSTPSEAGQWHCAHWDAEIPGADAQLQGCDEHIIHPDLTPEWGYEPAERGVIWLTPSGKIHNASDAYKSREIVANYVACASGIRDQYAQFDPEIVG